MSFPELTSKYMFRKGKECFQEGPWFYEAAKGYLRNCLHSEELTPDQRREARGILEDIKKIQTKV
jgi:hypothetical protein